MTLELLIKYQATFPSHTDLPLPDRNQHTHLFSVLSHLFRSPSQAVDDIAVNSVSGMEALGFNFHR